MTTHWERSPRGLQCWRFESQIGEEYQLLYGMHDFCCLFVLVGVVALS